MIRDYLNKKISKTGKLNIVLLQACHFFNKLLKDSRTLLEWLPKVLTFLRQTVQRKRRVVDKTASYSAIKKLKKSKNHIHSQPLISTGFQRVLPTHVFFLVIIAMTTLTWPESLFQDCPALRLCCASEGKKLQESTLLASSILKYNDKDACTNPHGLGMGAWNVCA